MLIVSFTWVLSLLSKHDIMDPVVMFLCLERKLNSQYINTYQQLNLEVGWISFKSGLLAIITGSRQQPGPVASLAVLAAIMYWLYALNMLSLDSQHDQPTLNMLRLDSQHATPTLNMLRLLSTCSAYSQHAQPTLNMLRLLSTCSP